MDLHDVNILIQAFRTDATNHAVMRQYLIELTTGGRAFAVSEFVLSSFVRVVTHPTALRFATPLANAIGFANTLRSSPNALLIAPGPGHWDQFTALCAAAGASGKLIPDAYLAALAIEHDCEFVTTDRDFARFPACAGGIRSSRRLTVLWLAASLAGPAVPSPLDSNEARHLRPLLPCGPRPILAR